ncbi:MAG TPA: N-acetyltransferase [Pyrinomonadaceae bacterium]|nr:N-acetyltransferase [Pyrinomonadaceae bacterium]
MIHIRPLDGLDPADLLRLITGYVSDARYRVSKTETGEHLALTLDLVHLPQPYVKHYEQPDAETLKHYLQVPRHGLSLGAYDAGGLCVGIALTEPRAWNQSLWVLEFHVAETHRGRGTGLRLMEALVLKARGARLRTIVCETQNTNAPAIRFYRKAGFRIEGLDLSYYSNDDFPDGEVAVFMKKRLT